ncbi:MAG TPA: hypothetical protein VKI64_01055 [Acidimicrobiales bacterium]|nr:hypothetical protein [Acidimicrobiales bacterium]
MKKFGLGLAVLALVGAGSLPAMATQGHQRTGTSSASCNDGTVSASPAILWPPNHKLVPVTVSYAEKGGSGDGDGDQISVTKIDVSMVDGNGNANVEGKGAGQPTAQQGPDFSVPSPLPGPVADTSTWSVDVGIRSERAGTVGNGSGRVYSLNVTCHDQGGVDPSDPAELTGQDGMATVFVCVPHDMSDASTTFCQNKISS